MFDEDMERKDNLSSGAKGDIFLKEKMVNTCFILLIRRVVFIVRFTNKCHDAVHGA